MPVARRYSPRVDWTLPAAVTLAAFSAQLGAQRNIPLREVGSVSARATEAVGLHLGAKELSDGRLLFNDAEHRRLLLFDRSLTSVAVIADTAGAGGFRYGRDPTPLIPYLGDSSLFLDFASQSLLVVDPDGKVARTAALPKPSDVLLVAGSRVIADAAGRLVYRGTYRTSQSSPQTAPGTYITRQGDTAPVVRASFETRQVDTLGQVKLAVAQSTQRVISTDGTVTTTIRVNPVTVGDDWSVCVDGSIAILRARDYHVDWVRPDGARSSTPRIPFSWRRIPDEEKQALADSARVAEEARIRDARERAAVARAAAPPGGQALGRGVTVTTNAQAGTSAAVTGDVRIGTVPLSDIPDYYPPFRPGAAQADLDGNIWILTYTSVLAGSTGSVYDVINCRADLVERVRLPAGRSIAAFGRAGAIYMVWRDTSSVWHLERGMVKR